MSEQPKKVEGKNEQPGKSDQKLKQLISPEPPKALEVEKDLMSLAMEAFGIKREHVLTSKIYGDHVVIVTCGGSKISFRRGDQVEKLSHVQLTGEPPPKPKQTSVEQ